MFLYCIAHFKIEYLRVKQSLNFRFACEKRKGGKERTCVNRLNLSKFPKDYPSRKNESDRPRSDDEKILHEIRMSGNES